MSALQHMTGLRTALWAVAAFAASCQPRTFHDSQVTHKAGELNRTTHPWQWAPIGRHDYVRLSLSRMPEGETLLEANHPLEQRADFWVKRIHAEMARIVQTKGGHVPPQPQALVFHSPAPNAFVTAVHYCFKGIPMVREDGISGRKQVGINLVDRGFHLAPDVTDCVEDNPYKERVGDIVAWMNERAPGCQMKLDGGKIIVNRTCQPIYEGLIEAEVTGFAISAYAPFVGISSALFSDEKLEPPFDTAQPEERFVATLAHELAHYYRGHHTQFGDDFDYWYLRKFPSSNEKPQPLADPQAKALVQKILDARRGTLPQIPGMRMSPTMFVFLRTLFLSSFRSEYERTRRNGTVPAYPVSCGQAWDWVFPHDGMMLSEAVLRYPHGGGFSDDPTTIEEFKAAENAFSACARDVAISGNSRDGSAVGLYGINSSLQYNYHVDYRVPDTAIGSRLESVLPGIESALLNAGEEFRANVRAAAQMGLGFYTQEEEADSIAVEVLAALGLKPEAAPEMFFQLGSYDEKNRGGHDQNTDVSMKECTQMRGTGWTTRPFPGFSLWHNNCYRIFNLDQEILAHGWKGAGLADGLVSPPWPELVKLARQTEGT